MKARNDMHKDPFLFKERGTPTYVGVERLIIYLYHMYDTVFNKKEFKESRKALRKTLTPAEAALWQYLKTGKLKERKFRRQVSIGKYIVDFYCPQENLVIEL